MTDEDRGPGRVRVDIIMTKTYFMRRFIDIVFSCFIHEIFTSRSGTHFIYVKIISLWNRMENCQVIRLYYCMSVSI